MTPCDTIRYSSMPGRPQAPPKSIDETLLISEEDRERMNVMRRIQKPSWDGLRIKIFGGCLMPKKGNTVLWVFTDK